MTQTPKRTNAMADFDVRMMMLGKTKGGTGMTPSLLLSTAKADIARNVRNNKMRTDDTITTKRYEATAFMLAHLKDTLKPSVVLARAANRLEDGQANAIHKKDFSRLLVYYDRELLKAAYYLAKKEEDEKAR